MDDNIFVVKRDGRSQKVSLDKIRDRIFALGQGLNVDKLRIVLDTVTGLKNGMKTTELDVLAAETASAYVQKHPDYAILSARIAISNLQKQTSDDFAETARRLYECTNKRTNEHTPVVSEEYYSAVKRHADRINSEIDYSRDYEYKDFGFRTLEKSYLLRVDGKIVERPQHMIMRVAIALYCTGGVDNIDEAIRAYHSMSRREYTHATPTLFNAGTNCQQLSSCFLLDIAGDSIDGIFKTVSDCAKISKTAGGIGLSVNKIRGRGAFISGTNGHSNGIVPMLRVFNSTACYVDQGGNKRPGSFAIYLEPWHADIMHFLELRLNTGKEEIRARDLFYAMWMPDLIMRRIEQGGTISLFSPNDVPLLGEATGAKFDELYELYERQGFAISTIPALDLYRKICETQIETGMPYMLYKDACNRLSNQNNLGTIKSSNLCAEIVQYTDPKMTAVCNLASIALPTFVENGEFNFARLADTARTLVTSLNRVIDINYYPVPEAEHSNRSLRPIGIGVQGLADTFMLMRFPFESEDAAKLNREIFETIYFAALDRSCDLAAQFGAYPLYNGSPVSRGILHPDAMEENLSNSRWDWNGLRARIAQHGVRNSLLTALMPTASTSQILGFNECFEPITSNIYSRRVSSGEFQVVNQYLVRDLMKIGLWNDSMRNAIIATKGSVQSILGIPEEIKSLYKTVWEMSQKTIINLARGRAPFVDQSQSMNLFLSKPTIAKVASMHMHSWKSGLKTGMYYLRTRPAADVIQFTVDERAAREMIEQKAPPKEKKEEHSAQKSDERSEEEIACSLKNPGACEMCSA